MAAPVIGKRLGHYEIQAKIGAGGMGEVYRALDTKLDREVALKILPPQMAQDADRRQRFEREAKAVAALRHPHIVTIHSVEEAEGCTFLTMELLEGQTLARLPARQVPRDRHPHRRCRWARALEGHHAPRSQARERHAGARPAGEGARLRPGEDDVARLHGTDGHRRCKGPHR
jgi:hypothetical protein